MIKFLIINGRFVVPMHKFQEIRQCRLVDQGEGTSIYSEGDINHFVKMELIEVIKQIHGFQRASDATYWFLKDGDGA